jgi:uroporphyrin-III C-methyltransferase
VGVRTNKPARITLVGAGPGAADLITLRGLRAIRSADVVLYDALSAPELLDDAPAGAIKYYVGKRAGRHSHRQESINELLVRLAYRYGHVVRLKGGDPFVFGRGHEETAYARQYGVPTEVVPGISSAISVPELQGVPPTRRGLSESFWVLTAATRHGTLSADVQLAARSNATAIILMGMRRLEEIMTVFLAQGRGGTPVMVVENGSRPDESVFLGSVATIAERVRNSYRGGPGLIVVGEVVGLHLDYAKAAALQQANNYEFSIAQAG